MSIQSNHEEAMRLAAEADVYRRAGNLDECDRALKKALKKEEEAARAILLKPEAEPSRSIICRSTAALASEVGCLATGERWLLAALNNPLGEPPMAEEIRDELRQIQDKIRNKQNTLKPHFRQPPIRPRNELSPVGWDEITLGMIVMNSAGKLVAG